MHWRVLLLTAMLALLGGCPTFPSSLLPDSGEADAKGVDSSSTDLSGDLQHQDTDADMGQNDGPEPDLVPSLDMGPDQQGTHANGEPCVSPLQCISGYCAHGVCCDEACSTPCRACDLQGNEGTCTNVPVGEDPHSDCPQLLAVTCGTDGVCDGQGACRFFPKGSSCGSTACNAAGTALIHLECDGLGSCKPVEKDCFPYNCDSSNIQCYSDCDDSNEKVRCQGWYGCNHSKKYCYDSCQDDNHCKPGGSCNNKECEEST
jgi:hypothetical protein